MKCPKCQSQEKIKYGNKCGRQRYLCKGCGCNYTKSTKYKISEEVRTKALQLYLEGLGFRSIERILGISNVIVMHWVRELGEEIEKFRKPKAEQVSVMELDEMWHYVSEKNEKSGCGLRMIVIEDKSLTSKSVAVMNDVPASSGTELDA